MTRKHRKEREFQQRRAQSARRDSAAARRRQQKRKEERVKEELRTLPGWTLRGDHQALDCTREFTQPEAIVKYANLVTVMTVAERQPVALLIHGNTVSVMLPPRPGAAALTAPVFELARQLG